ncbi:MAG: hypothetical protein ABIJ34_09260 [archaeon]
MRKLFLLAMILLYIGFAYANPTLNVSNMTAEAGNVTFIDFNASGSQSDIWQGYFGTVSGGITLDDAAGKVFYDWTVVDAVGEVLATRELISDWSLINCSNQTQIYREEEKLNIPNESNNGINDTYLLTSHPTFEIGGKFMEGCRSTKTNNETTSKARFWNVILNSNSSNTVYVALIDNDQVGFNGTLVDFQLLVPTNKTSRQATYNLYLDLS